MEPDQLIKEAEKRGYISIKDNKITYNCHKPHTDDFSDPEEKVRAFIYSWLTIEKKYSPEHIKVEVSVPRRKPGDYADIVLYKDSRCRVPYLVVENKAEGITEAQIKKGIEQGFGNANSFRVTKYMLFDCESYSALYDIANFPHDERKRNFLGIREALMENYGEPGQYLYIAGTTSDIHPVSSKKLENKVRRAHALIWSGGKRDPLKSFDEWSKLLFAKIWDERHTPNKQPRRFQRGVRENPSEVGKRIRMLFNEARKKDPSIFTESTINLTDEKITDTVEVIQDVGVTLMDIDALGHAFEHFFGAIFRGELGQYFTRRELVRFICGLIRPDDKDFVMDPACGSGGFLLETLIQVWHSIDSEYSGQPDIERRKYDFAQQNLFGVEIHEILGRVCKTNLMLHKDGHINIETDRSCLDSQFDNTKIKPDGSIYTVVIGNPPFGDKVREGDSDQLGSSKLSDFELGKSQNQVKSEIIIIERALQFLTPGGRLGMVVPDGLLNNTGENSLCPKFRRFIFRNAYLDAIVSLPDFAFRKVGAQNKTSLLFLRKYTQDEKIKFDKYYDRMAKKIAKDKKNLSDEQVDEEVIRELLRHQKYPVFMAEAEFIGYNPAGAIIEENELYNMSNWHIDYSDIKTILGQYVLFEKEPINYHDSLTPRCIKIQSDQIADSRRSYRIDPKYHIFEREEIKTPKGMTKYKMADLLQRRLDRVIPTDHPDTEFKVITLTQEGEINEREAGKGNNPPTWHGQYFSDGSRWYKVKAGDLIYSQIDLWKGCVGIVPESFDGAIVTQEFPIMKVKTDLIDPYYLKLLLRSEYFQRAIRAITTGHSNRRRTQETDFLELELFLPELKIQQSIGEFVQEMNSDIRNSRMDFENVLSRIDKCIIGKLNPESVMRELITNKE